MKKLITIAVFILLSGCGESTGPSDQIRDQLVVIDTATGSVTETVNLTTGGNYRTEISSDGDFLYIIRFDINHITKFNLNSMLTEWEGKIPGRDNYLVNSAISANDSLFFVQGGTNKLYKILTADMVVADTLALPYSSFCYMEARPGSDLLYMSSYEEQLCIFNTTQMVFEDTLNIFLDSEIFFSDTGDEMYLFSGGELSAYDPDTGEKLRSKWFPGIISSMEIPIGGSNLFILWVTPTGDEFDITLVELDRLTFSTLETLENAPNSGFIRYSEQISRLFLYPSADNGISVLGMPGFQAAGEVDMDEYVRSMILSPDQSKLYCLVYYNGI